MPIVKRSIFHAQCYASPDLYADTTPDSALVDVNMARMTVTLQYFVTLSLAVLCATLLGTSHA